MRSWKHRWNGTEFKSQDWKAGAVRATVESHRRAGAEGVYLAPWLGGREMSDWVKPGKTEIFMEGVKQSGTWHSVPPNGRLLGLEWFIAPTKAAELPQSKTLRVRGGKRIVRPGQGRSRQVKVGQGWSNLVKPIIDVEEVEQRGDVALSATELPFTGVGMVGGPEESGRAVAVQDAPRWREPTHCVAGSGLVKPGQGWSRLVKVGWLAA